MTGTRGSGRTTSPTTDELEGFYREWALRSARFAPAVSEGPAAIARARAGYTELLLEHFPPLPDQVFRAASVAGVPGERLVADRPDGGRLLLFLHGGAYHTGEARGYRQLVGMLARRLRATAFTPDYRLAPESPFPAAVVDAVAVYRGLLDEGRRSEEIVLAGDSAGGGLALATLVSARSQGLPMPAAVLTFSPWADLVASGASSVDRDGIDPLNTGRGLDAAAALVLAGAPAHGPLASPAVADLTGLPPTLVQVGSREVILSSAVRLAGRLAEDGVRVRFETAPGMGHVYVLFAASLEPATRALQSAADFAEAALPPLPPAAAALPPG